MAPSLAECERIMNEAARAAELGLVFLIAEQSQYFSFILAAQECIASGSIGEVTVVRGLYRDQKNNMWQDVLPGEHNEKAWRWIQEQSGGGKRCYTRLPSPCLLMTTLPYGIFPIRVGD